MHTALLSETIQDLTDAASDIKGCISLHKCLLIVCEMYQPQMDWFHSEDGVQFRMQTNELNFDLMMTRGPSSAVSPIGLWHTSFS